MRVSFFIAIVAFFTTNVLALSPAGWRSQSIYQVLTDRFARTDGSTKSTCNTEDQVYCGGTWQGIINHLDYIQSMGFTAVRIFLLQKSFRFPRRLCWLFQFL
jgi:alpha-amylase